MDPSIPKLIKEEDEGKSIHAEEAVNTKFRISLIPDLKGSVSPSVTTQQASRPMVKFPFPSKTIPKTANVRTTPILPSVGQKKPSRKKQKLCGNSSDGSIEKLNDVTALSGINLRKEKKQLLSSGPKKDGCVSKTSRNVVHEDQKRTFLGKVALQRKLAEIMAKSGLKHIDNDVERCLSSCVEERMRGLLSNIIRISKQRIDPEKCRNRTYITSDIRKQINEMNYKAKKEWKKKHVEEESAKEYGHRLTTEAANIASHKALGRESSDETFLRWKLMAEGRQKTSPGPPKNDKKLSSETGGRRFVRHQGLRKVNRSISVKDVIAVIEKERQMSRSTLLYRLYNRV